MPNIGQSHVKFIQFSIMLRLLSDLHRLKMVFRDVDKIFNRQELSVLRRV